MIFEQEQGIYEFHNFQLNIGKGILLREGQPVSMQWKTFETLCVFAKSNGNLISRDELINKLWADTFVEDNNLSQHIRALRKTLGEGENGRRFIETVPRRGYRFLPEVRIVDSAKQAAAIVSPNNLSTQSATLIGREKEIAEIKNLLQRADIRLLTLTGVGGTGKTTLAKTVAREMLLDFKDGVFFVELAAVTNPELVVSTIAQTLGVKETGGKPILEMLEDYLREKQMLLIVDNFEQVLPAAPVLANLVKIAPDLKILVTSRALLHLSAGFEFVVPPLAVPESSAQISLDELSENESVRLFVERARLVKSNFAISPENAPSVAEICRRLDGLPLAIELAAARVKIISPQSILERLENRLKLLTGGAKDLPARQQTVRGMVEWSYELLDENEKRLYYRLAVFAGGFTFEAAEAVCANYDSTENRKPMTKDQLEVLNGITSLINKSLLVQKEQSDGEPRFRMLEVVREYALETLEASAEAEAIRRSHAAYFLALGEEAEPYLETEKSVEWLDHLEEEHDNLRAALRWSLENDSETATRLAVALRFFWVFHSHLTEGRRWLEAALERGRLAVPAAVRFKLVSGLGHAARNQGDYETARKAYKEALTEGRAAGDLPQIALSSRGLGVLANLQGDFTAARKFIEEALAISRRIDDKLGIGASLNRLGELARMEGDNTAARPLIDEALAIARQLGNKQGVCANLINLGVIAYHEGDFRTARSHFTEALEAAQELGDKVLTAYSLNGFASLAAEREDAKHGAKLAGAAEQLHEQIDYKIDFSDRRFRDAYLTELKTTLDEADFAEFYEQGRKLKLEEAIKLALEKI